MLWRAAASLPLGAELEYNPVTLSLPIDDWCWIHVPQGCGFSSQASMAFLRLP